MLRKVVRCLRGYLPLHPQGAGVMGEPVEQSVGKPRARGPTPARKPQARVKAARSHGRGSSPSSSMYGAIIDMVYPSNHLTSAEKAAPWAPNTGSSFDG
jgi:hypothetical protein